MIQVIRCKVCGGSVDMCREPECYTDSAWQERLSSYVLEGQKVQMESDEKAITESVCLCDTRPNTLLIKDAVSTNPLLELKKMFGSADWSKDKDELIAKAYGVIIGWGEEDVTRLKEKFGWSDFDIESIKLWNQNFTKCVDDYISQTHVFKDIN